MVNFDWAKGKGVVPPEAPANDGRASGVPVVQPPENVPVRCPGCSALFVSSPGAMFTCPSCGGKYEMPADLSSKEQRRAMAAAGSSAPYDVASREAEASVAYLDDEKKARLARAKEAAAQAPKIPDAEAKEQAESILAKLAGKVKKGVISDRAASAAAAITAQQAVPAVQVQPAAGPVRHVEEVDRRPAGVVSPVLPGGRGAAAEGGGGGPAEEARRAGDTDAPAAPERGRGQGQGAVEEEEGAQDLDPDAQYSCIFGSAGVGKTFQARRLPGELCATTGIAALNLGAGVSTINSLLGFFDTAGLRDQFVSGALMAKLSRLYKAGVHRIIVDEVSMMDGEQLSLLVQAIDELAGGAAGWKMGLTLVGDFCQLPPVKAKFAFEVDAFERFRKNILTLRKIRRQEDREFVEVLQSVRRGEISKAVDYFAQPGRLERTAIQEFPGVTILAKNDEVDRYNLIKHTGVKGDLLTWKTTRFAEQRQEWAKIPSQTSVKVGALVMVLANEKEIDLASGMPTGEYLYVNGDIGVVVGKGVDSVDGEAYAAVKLHRRAGRTRYNRATSEEVPDEVVHVKLVTRENLVPCDADRRKVLRENKPDVLRGDREQWECIGWVQYMPLRLAYATTVHKSQGLTLDNVQISIANHFWQNGGMLYVALSRARTVQGLRLVGSVERLRRVIVSDPRVKEWQ